MVALLTGLVDAVGARDSDGGVPSRASEAHGDVIPPFPVPQAALRYIQWHKSMPFDMGLTCGRALAFAKDHTEISHNAHRYSALNEGNGALMRCAPLACWGLEMGCTCEEMMDVARADARLTHPNVACLDANAML
jgi:ADP-ribosylglycohydrolase